MDDVTEGLVELDPGVRFDPEKFKMVKHEELVESDKNVKGDKRTMDELKKIANTVYKCVQFTDDYPSNHPSGRMPVLDLQMFVSEKGQIMFEFFQKPMACKFVIPYKSAHSKKMKLAVMVEEGLRRLRNHSRGMDWEVKRKVMEEWSRKLRRSGYPQTFRHQVVKSAVVKYEKMCKVEDDGGRPMYRSREWHESARRMEKERKLVSWHQTEKDTVSAPLILDPTAGGLTSKIKLICQKFEKTSGFRILVKERAGDAVRQDARSEPLRNRSCGRGDCLFCSSGKPGSCEVNSVGYRI